MTSPVKAERPGLAAISERLCRARLEARALNAFPGVLPDNSLDAYRIQHRSIGHWPTRLVGFKVGGITPNFRTQFAADWLAGAVFEDEVFHIEDGERAQVDVFKGGFAAYEAEWIFTIADVPWDKADAFDLDEAISVIRQVNIGTEIASSPMPMINALGPGAIISDFGNNSSVWLGPKTDLSILKTLDDITVKVAIDGMEIGRAAAKSGEAGPVGAVRFLLNHLKKYRTELELPNSFVVSSGAVTGVHDSQVGSHGLIEFDGLGSFTLAMVPKVPRT